MEATQQPSPILRERLNIRIGGNNKMIGRCRAQLCRERGAAEVVELVSVDFDGESQRPSPGQDLTRDWFKSKALVSQNTSTNGSASRGA